MSKHLDTVEKLCNFTDDPLLYELEMFCNGASRLSHIPWATDPASPEERTERNAFLESFVIHLRNLWEFLYANTSWNDRVTIRTEYLPNWTVEPPEQIRRAYGQACQQIAHLTSARMNLSQWNKEWDFRELEKHVLKDLSRFVEQAGPQLVGPNFRARLIDLTHVPRAKPPTARAATSKPSETALRLGTGSPEIAPESQIISSARTV